MFSSFCPGRFSLQTSHHFPEQSHSFSWYKYHLLANKLKYTFSGQNHIYPVACQTSSSECLRVTSNSKHNPKIILFYLNFALSSPAFLTLVISAPTSTNWIHTRPLSLYSPPFLQPATEPYQFHPLHSPWIYLILSLSSCRPSPFLSGKLISLTPVLASSNLTPKNHMKNSIKITSCRLPLLWLPPYPI